MKQVLYTVTGNRELAPGVWEMSLAGDTSPITAPGQFINIKLDGFFLRRPISVCDWDSRGLTIIYKVVGKGTAVMSAMQPGQELDVLSGLGNGFDVAKCGRAAHVRSGQSAAGGGKDPLCGAGL